MDAGSLLLLIAATALGAACGYAFPTLARAIRERRHYRGLRLVTCPETGEPAAVSADTRSAVRAALDGHSEVRLCECSRWPERAGCAQGCVAQLQGDPEQTKVSAIVERWYAGKKCAYCHKAILAGDRVANWLDHGPAFLDVFEITEQWSEVAPESLPTVFKRALPVCWNCHEAQAFRRDFPELVTDRPAH
jgi:hypothetical protein